LDRLVEFEGDVVAGALVVLTVEVVVEVAVVLVLVLEAVLPLELELDVVAAEVVVVAETLAKEAEYAEQRAKPTDSAAITSDAAQAVTRQGAAYPPRTAMVAGLHWQPSSVRAHPADEMAASRHGTWMSTVRIQSTYFSQSIELWEKRGQDGRDSVV
jgi:isocitrate lyase